MRTRSDLRFCAMYKRIRVAARWLAFGSAVLLIMFSSGCGGGSSNPGSGGGGNTPAVSLSPQSLSFGNQTVGTRSGAQAVMVANTGNVALNMTGISAGGDFAETNTCGSSVATNASCTVSVTFTPSASGSRTGALTFMDNASSSPQTVTLSGTGTTSPTPGATVSPTSLTFSNQTVQTTSSPQMVTLTNSGSATLTITSIATTGDFAQTNTCGSSIAANASCTVNVTFTPTTTGTRTGTLNFTDNASSSPQRVNLTGTGVTSTPTHDPLGTVTSATSANCPAGGVAGTACYNLTISCPGVADFNAMIKVTTPSGTPAGTVIFTTGSGGNSLYDTTWTYGANVVSRVVGAGFTAVQTNFYGGATGWMTGPAADGPRQLACRYATLAQWVHDNPSVHQGGSTKPLCATGNSAGASCIAYSLSHYGLGTIFAMVEPTSGPPHGRVDYGCICNQPDSTAPCSTGTLLSTCYGTGTAQTFFDAAYGNTWCSSAVTTHDTTHETLFYHDSVASTDATYNYPTTFVRVLFGGFDNGPSPVQAMEWVNLITSQKTFLCVPDATHEMLNALDAATQIGNDLVNGCHF